MVFFVAPEEVAEFEVATVEDVGAACAGEATASVVDDEVFCLLFLRKPTFTTPFAAGAGGDSCLLAVFFALVVAVSSV